MPNNKIQNAEEEEKIIIDNFFVTNEELQTYAETYYGRQLTEIELNEIKEFWFEGEKAYMAKIDFILAVLEDILGKNA